MKKLACLLVLASAVGVAFSATCSNANANPFIARLDWLNWGIKLANEGPAVSFICNNSPNLCCESSKLASTVEMLLQTTRANFEMFFNSVSNIGRSWSKIETLLASTFDGKTSDQMLELAAATEISGASSAQFKDFSHYDKESYIADFEAAKTYIPDCFQQYSKAIKTIPCEGCLNTAAVPAAFNDPTYKSIKLNQASVETWTANCYKVWNFMWKAGWFAQTVGYLNYKKSPATTSYSSPTVYFRSDIYTVGTVNEAFQACGTQASFTSTTCTLTHKATMLSTFARIFTTENRLVGRSETSFLPYTGLASNARLLQMSAPPIEGFLTLDATSGFDYLAAAAANNVVTPLTQVTMTWENVQWMNNGLSSVYYSSFSYYGSSKAATHLVACLLTTVLAALLLN